MICVKMMSERRLGERFKNHGAGLGPGGLCWCPKCGYQEKHEVGVPCFTKPCPKCGESLRRKVGSVVQGFFKR